MKKVVSAAVFCVMILCSVLTVFVSADGAIIWKDDFSTKDYSNWLWDPPANLFDIENGKVEGWAECVVLQSNYISDQGGTRRFKECAWKVDACGLEDGGRDAENHALGIWFADYISPYGSEEPDGQIVYELHYCFEKKLLELFAAFDGAGADFEPTSGYTRGEPVMTVSVPDGEAPAMDPAGNEVFSIGIRVNGGVISGFLNDKKYLDFNAYRGATSFTQLGSPTLLINIDCHCTFDNVVVSTPDYNLFNESAASDPTPTPAQTDTEKVIETKVVHDTDEEGNDVTVIVTEEVVRPAANVGGQTTGGTATKTGDAAIVAAAVGVLALTAAITVCALAYRRKRED